MVITTRSSKVETTTSVSVLRGKEDTISAKGLVGISDPVINVRAAISATSLLHGTILVLLIKSMVVGRNHSQNHQFHAIPRVEQPRRTLKTAMSGIASTVTLKNGDGQPAKEGSLS